MGLDVFWVVPKGKKNPVFNPPLSLRNCWMLDNGTFTFGDYSVFLFELSGVPQHEREISSVSVKTIADSFDMVTRKEFNRKSKWCRMEAREWNELKRMFKAYAKIGASMRVSY
jgi:hypothetical protein